eukprot:PITA_04988
MVEESQFEQSLASCICAVTFIALLLMDAWKAWKGRMHWIRGGALSLSVLTMQLLTVIGNDNITDDNGHQIKRRVATLLEKDQLVIDSRRLMLCVFIGYLVPGMARLHESWIDIATLVASVVVHMASELQFVWKYIHANDEFSSKYSLWFTVYSTVLFIAIILLVVVLLCSALVGIGLDNITSHKIPLALSCCSNSAEEGKCKTIEDHILKCWIVARACRPDYVIARSVFSAFAGTVVTICVVVFAVKLKYVHHDILNNYLYQTTVFILLGFVFIGWIVILIRWFTAVLYFPIYFPRNVSYIKDLWEISNGDLWAIILGENPLANFLTDQLFLGRRIPERIKEENATVNLMKVFAIFLLWLEMLIVLLSKACWLLSEIVFLMIRPCILSREKNMLLSCLNESALGIFREYRDALEITRLPGEKACSMWIANESAFKQTENHMKQGVEKGKNNSKELINLLRCKTEAAEDEVDTSLEREKHLKEVAKKSWKMRAVSLIKLMIYFYDGNEWGPVNNAIQAYIQARDCMDMVEGFDWKCMLMSEAADSEFNSLQNIWTQYMKSNQRKVKDSMKLLEDNIKKPLRKDMEQLSKQETPAGIVNESKEWMTLAANISLHQKWNAIHDSANAVHNLESSLANVIFHCIQTELKKALIENCMEWAHDGMEEKILYAAFVAGKAKGVFAQIGDGKGTVHDRV